MATHDEEDVRSRNTRRTLQPRNRDFRTVKRISEPNTANAGALALTLGTAAPTLGQIARGVMTGVGASLGTISGMSALPALTIGSIPLMIAYEMSGKGRPTGIVPNYNIENSRYIAQPDATTVTLRPSPAGDYLYSSRKKNKSNNRSAPTATEPEPLPVDVNGSTEENPVSGVAAGETLAELYTILTGQTTATPEPENNDKKRKLPKSIKKIGSNLGKLYGKIGTGFGYALGVAPIAGLGYGMYKWLEPEKTPMDSTIEVLYKQAEDYGKLNTILDLQERLDSMRNAINNRMNRHNSLQSTSSVDTIYPVAELDTLNLW